MMSMSRALPQPPCITNLNPRPNYGPGPVSVNVYPDEPSLDDLLSTDLDSCSETQLKQLRDKITAHAARLRSLIQQTEAPQIDQAQLRVYRKRLMPITPQRQAKHCDELLQRSLFLVGEIGGNDYNHALLAGVSMEVVETFVSPVIKELLDMGAMTLVVPGNFPIGCSAAYLTTFMTSSSMQDYDPQTGCLNWLNDFAMQDNTMLKTALARIQESHPHANIIYADYYNAAMQLFLNPYKFGFSKGAITACCGGDGPYHYNATAMCGQPLSTVCEDSSLYVNWDGLHLTEAAYSFLFQELFQGPQTIPPFSSLCSAASHPLISIS